MKHVIAFLGHQQPRIQNPVYLRFANTPSLRRKASLIFTARQLDERSLANEVNDLRRRGDSQDQEVCFHLCADLTVPMTGQQLMQTVLLIQKLYDRPAYLYCRMPDLAHCTTGQRNTAWKGLTSINSCLNDYPQLRLVSLCFLYDDATQSSLAEMLHMMTSQPEVLAEVERHAYEGEPEAMDETEMTGDRCFEPAFPRVFASFNATTIRYPEEEVHYHLHLSYLEALLQLTRPGTNPIDMELCNEHVNAMMAKLPLTTGGLTLTEGAFIELPQTQDNTSWPDAAAYWQQSLQQAASEMQDMPRTEWPTRMRRRMQMDYDTRYRKQGVEAYYDRQCTLTPHYRAVMEEQLRLDLNAIMRTAPYPPETSRDIIRSLVNRLQVLAMKLSERHDKLTDELKEQDCELARLTTQWEGMGFFDRMRGKDKELLKGFESGLKDYYVKRTLARGLGFGSKLLNELIPQVVALPSEENRLGEICQGALDSVTRSLADHTPEEFLPAVFDHEPLSQAVQSIRADRERLHQDYETVRQLLYPRLDNAAEQDGKSFLLRLRDTLDEQIDAYIKQRIDKGTMPLVLDLDVMQRLEAAYADQGGLTALVEDMKKETALSLALKGKGGLNEQYLLISPVCASLRTTYYRAEDASSVTMLHLMTGISLTDLDGFAGQRMFVEPSMF